MNSEQTFLNVLLEILIRLVQLLFGAGEYMSLLPSSSDVGEDAGVSVTGAWRGRGLAVRHAAARAANQYGSTVYIYNT